MAPTELNLNVDRTTSNAYTVIEAAGELDLASCTRLRRELLTALQRGGVVLAAADIAFCDSAGLRTLVEALHAAKAAGVNFRLAAPSDAVMLVLELAGAARLFEIFPDVQTALKD